MPGKRIIQQVYLLLLLVLLFNIVYFFINARVYLVIPVNIIGLIAHFVLPVAIAASFAILYFSSVDSRQAHIFLLLGIMIAGYGKGMHYVANEINPNREYSGNDALLSKIYFLDEYFSHFILGIGIAVVLAATLFCLGRFSSGALGVHMVFISLLSSVSTGLTAFMFALEAHQVLSYVICTVIMVPGMLYIFRRQNVRISENPMAAAIFATLITSYVLLAGWWLVFHSFPQPMAVLR